MLCFITFLQPSFPTLEGNVLASSFGAPETFRVPQNTTCYVRLNIKTDTGKSRDLLSKTNKIMNRNQ